MQHFGAISKITVPGAINNSRSQAQTAISVSKKATNP